MTCCNFTFSASNLRELGAEKREFKVSELDSTGYRNLEEETDEKVLSKNESDHHRTQTGFALD